MTKMPCLEPAVHGSIDFGEIQRLGLRVPDVLDFSANVNPYGPSPTVRAALERLSLERYPDRGCRELTSALAEVLDVDSNCILPGNGASELIWLAAAAFVGPGDPVLVLGPTYSEYARASALFGARVHYLQSRNESHFKFDSEQVAGELETARPRLLFVCNPNNPTGSLIAPETIADWARRHPRTLVVVDEAYQSFLAEAGSVVPMAQGNILVLRSMTKDYGLAGLRLGYAIADEPVIASLRQAQPPWSVNSPAQAAGVAALGDLDHRAKSLRLLAESKKELVGALTRLGLPPVPSTTHYFLVRVGNGAEFRMKLLGRGVLVRDCASFGLPEFIRIAARRPDENERLLAAIREVR